MKIVFFVTVKEKLDEFIKSLDTDIKYFEGKMSKYFTIQL